MLLRLSGWASQSLHTNSIAEMTSFCLAVRPSECEQGGVGTHQDRSQVEVPARGHTGSCDLEPGISDS